MTNEYKTDFPRKTDEALNLRNKLDELFDGTGTFFSLIETSKAKKVGVAEFGGNDQKKLSGVLKRISNDNINLSKVGDGYVLGFKDTKCLEKLTNKKVLTEVILQNNDIKGKEGSLFVS